MSSIVDLNSEEAILAAVDAETAAIAAVVVRNTESWRWPIAEVARSYVALDAAVERAEAARRAATPARPSPSPSRPRTGRRTRRRRR